MSKFSVHVSNVMLAAALGLVAVSCTTEKVVSTNAPVQKPLTAEGEAETIGLAKALLDYLTTPNEESRSIDRFAAWVGKTVKHNTGGSQLQVAFFCNDRTQYGHYDLETKMLTMGDAPLENHRNCISLGLGSSEISCSFREKRVEMTVNKAPDGSYRFRLKEIWTLG